MSPTFRASIWVFEVEIARAVLANAARSACDKLLAAAVAREYVTVLVETAGQIAIAMRASFQNKKFY